MSEWIMIDQDFFDNIGIEILEIEGKQFISITKYEKTKNIVIPIDRVDELVNRIRNLTEKNSYPCITDPVEVEKKRMNMGY